MGLCRTECGGKGRGSAGVRLARRVSRLSWPAVFFRGAIRRSRQPLRDGPATRGGPHPAHCAACVDWADRHVSVGAVLAATVFLRSSITARAEAVRAQSDAAHRLLESRRMQLEVQRQRIDRSDEPLDEHGERIARSKATLGADTN